MIGLTHLPHQLKDEKTVVLLRRHWLIFALQIILFLGLGLIPLLARAFINNFFPNLLEVEASAAVVIIIGFAYYLLWWLFFYRAWVDYYLDAWIVTTHRVLSIELERLFSRTVSEHKLFRIQDVTTEQHGILAHIFNYGDVHVQTAAAEKRFVFEQVPRPDKVAQQITQMIAWHKRAYPNEN